MDEIGDGKRMTFVCVICGNVAKGYGHNPQPLADYDAGRACDNCNSMRVVPERLRRISRGESAYG